MDPVSSLLRPVAVWPSGPLEVIAAFHRPISPAVGESWNGRTIPYFPTGAPPAGQPLPSRPAGALRIVAARRLDDGRTLVLATDPHPRVARYLLPLPRTEVARSGTQPQGARDPAVNPVPGSDATVTYDLTGVEVTWSERDHPDGEPTWSGWWPRLDTDITRRLIRGSKPHEDGLALLSRPGRVTLSTLVRFPAGTVAVRIDASAPIEEALLGDARAEVGDPKPGEKPHPTVLTVESLGIPLFLTITARTLGGEGPFSLKASYRLGGTPTDRPIDQERLMVPWAPVTTDAAIAAPLAVPDLSGGDPTRGQVIFSGDQARCAQCHSFRGQGGKAGPDLTDIGRKGRAEIYRDIAVPSAAIEPDFTSYTVATRAGQVVVGVVRAEGADTIRVTDTNAKDTIVPRHEIQEIRPSATSIMPPGLAAALGNAAVRDLIAFLTSSQPPRTATRSR